jgi:hypothetical protein
MFANDKNNIELFKVLLRNFNGTIRSLNKYRAEFKDEIDALAASK